MINKIIMINYFRDPTIVFYNSACASPVCLSLVIALQINGKIFFKGFIPLNSF